MFSHVLIESLQGKKNDTVVSFENFKYGNAKLLSIRFNSSGSEMTEKMEKKIKIILKQNFDVFYQM
jgi:hypothetical protein